MKEFCPYCQNDPVTHQQQKEICGICDMETKVAKRKNICSKCEHSSYCDMSIRYDEKIVMVDCSRFKEKHKQTRADKLRSMTDEELAEWLNDTLVSPYFYLTTAEAWLCWLKEEVDV